MQSARKCDALEAKLADLRVYASPRAALTNTLEHDSEVPSDLAPQQTQDEAIQKVLFHVVFPY
jgi:hypothetical protein